VLVPFKKVGREEAKLTKRKNTHIPVHGAKNFYICLSITDFDLNYFRIGKTK
jgi:hypothetical protein